MGKEWTLIILSLIAGAAGTGIGGALGVLFAGAGDKTCGRTLGFAGGVMLGVVFFEMLPEAASSFKGDRGMSAAILATFAAGMALVGALGKLVAAIYARGEKRKRAVVASGFWGAVGVFGEVGGERKRDGRKMLRAGGIMFFAIALHNFPEGMAIGGAGAHEMGAGIMIALAIAAHNVPEGMAIGAPLCGGGASALKAVGLACLAGLATVPGAAVGLLLGGIGETASAMCLSFAGGAMTFVTLDDIFKESARLAGGLPSVCVAIGLIAAAAFIYLP